MASAGARLHRTGSIFSRIHDLLKCDVIAFDDRPLWYDVYKAFPPMREPVYMEDPGPDELGLVNVKDNVRPIFYAEDWARANFMALPKHNRNKKPFLMLRNEEKLEAGTPSVVSFVNTYQDFRKKFPDLSKEEIFENAMESEGNRR